jgi:hypothetical protein
MRDQPVSGPLPIERTTHTINAHRHPCLEWDSNSWSQCWAGENSSRLRPRGHFDRQYKGLSRLNFFFSVVLCGSFCNCPCCLRLWAVLVWLFPFSRTDISSFRSTAMQRFAVCSHFTGHGKWNSHSYDGIFRAAPLALKAPMHLYSSKGTI